MKRAMLLALVVFGCGPKKPTPEQCADLISWIQGISGALTVDCPGDLTATDIECFHRAGGRHLERCPGFAKLGIGPSPFHDVQCITVRQQSGTEDRLCWRPWFECNMQRNMVLGYSKGITVTPCEAVAEAWEVSWECSDGDCERYFETQADCESALPAIQKEENNVVGCTHVTADALRLGPVPDSPLPKYSPL